MKKSLLSLIIITILSSGLVFGKAEAATATIAEKSPTTEISSITFNIDDADNYVNLSEEEYIQRKSEITGQSAETIRIQLNKENKSKSGLITTQDAVTVIYREYYMLIHLGGNIYAKAGVLTKVNQFMFGQSVSYRFSSIDSSTPYLNAYSGGSFTIVKNYATAILEDDRNLVLAASGYAEVAVTSGTSSGVNLTGGELISIGWSVESSTSTTTYYRKHFSASTRITLAA